jgi:hypothetical protein
VYPEGSPTADTAGGLNYCLDCGDPAGHDDTCPQRRDLLNLLDADLAGLLDRGGRPFSRPLHRVEVTHLEAAIGHRVPRRDRRRWSVRVHPWGPDAVCRVIRDGTGRVVAEFIAQPAGIE